MPVSADWQAIAWNGGVFCAVASNFPSTIAATLPMGITWTQRTLPVSASWEAITWNGSVFCAVASGGTIAATSPDGITWTQRALPVSEDWQVITWNGSVFCAVANNSTIAATSPDGIIWTQRTLPVSANWRAIAWGAGVFCAVASDSTIAATSKLGSDIGPINATLSSVNPSKCLVSVNGEAWCSLRASLENTAIGYSLDSLSPTNVRVILLNSTGDLDVINYGTVSIEVVEFY